MSSKRKSNLNSDSSESDSDLSDSEFQNLAKKRKKSPPKVSAPCWDFHSGGYVVASILSCVQLTKIKICYVQCIPIYFHIVLYSFVRSAAAFKRTVSRDVQVTFKYSLIGLSQERNS
jgi:hypothetical protein